jgi:hypothetical protein
MKVYKYNCEPASAKSAGLAFEQLKKANNYRRALMNVENQRRRQYRALDAEDQAIVWRSKKIDLLVKYIAMVHDDKKLVQSKKKVRLDLLKRGLKRVKDELKVLRAKRAETEEYKVRLKKIQDDHHTAEIAARKEASDGGLYWGTYLIVEDAYKRSCKETPIYHDLRFSPCRTLAVQVQISKPLSGAQLIGTNDRRVRFSTDLYSIMRDRNERLFEDGPSYRVRAAADAPRHNKANEGANRERYRELSFRIGSEEKGAPIWSFFHVLTVDHKRGTKRCERLPTGPLKWVRIHYERIGVRDRWNVQFVVAEDFEQLAWRKNFTVGIDIGWRRVEGGIRIAYAVGSDGFESQLVIPDHVIDRKKKSFDLQEIRDREKNVYKGLISIFRGTLPPDHPFVELTKELHLWRKDYRFLQLHRYWKNHRIDGDDELFHRVEKWLFNDRHLNDWQKFNVRRMALQVRGRQACWVAELAQRYATFGIEGDFNIARMRNKNIVSDEMQRAAVAHAETAPGALRELLKHQENRGVTIVSVTAAKTTTTCCRCGFVRKPLFQEDLMLKCEKCGKTEDQDKNAAINIMRIADEQRREERKERTVAG